MSDLIVRALHPAASVADLEDQFLNEEIGFEIVEFGIGTKGGNQFNYVRERQNLDELQPLQIKMAPAAGATPNFLQGLVDTGFTILEGTFSGLIDGKTKSFVVCRPQTGGAANPIVIRGKMSFFGGPADTGVRTDEGLALVEPTEMPLYPPNMFLTPAEAGAAGLARRLNPKKPYLACRWSELGLPIKKFRKFLQSVEIEVENPANGKKMTGVRAVDLGPGILSRVTDLSPLFDEPEFGLDTDQTVIVRIPRPAQTGAILAGAKRPIDSASNLRDMVQIPQGINAGLHAVTELAMLQKFGKPGALTKDCSAPDPAFAQLLVTDNVGPFRVEGLKAAVDSLKKIFSELGATSPVFQEVSTEGMLCVRSRRPDPAKFSNHSFGTAIDLRFGPHEVDQGTPLTQRGFLDLFPIFNKHGWFWGAGSSGKSVDSMHFELSAEAIAQI